MAVSIGNNSPGAVVTRDLRHVLIQAAFFQARLPALETSVRALIAEVERLHDQVAVTDAELGAERLAALLDAERENTALRAEVMYLRAERAGMDEWLRTMVPNDKATAAERAAVVAWLRRAAWWDCDDCGFDGKRLVEAIELRLHRAGEEA